MVVRSKVSAWNISNWLMAVLGRKLHPANQPIFFPHACAFSSDQRWEVCSAANEGVNVARIQPVIRIRFKFWQVLISLTVVHTRISIINLFMTRIRRRRGHSFALAMAIEVGFWTLFGDSSPIFKWLTTNN